MNLPPTPSTRERSTRAARRVAVDGATLAAARAGDDRAWRDLLATVEPDLFAFARRRGAPDPDDVVQDVLTAAAEKLGTFDGSPKQFRSWLFTVAHRRVADVHRRRYRAPEMTSDEGIDHTADGIGSDEIVQRAESVSEAIAALGVLEDRERAVVLARIIEERSVSDVADRLGLSDGNVRVIQSRALAKVRRHLEAQAADFEEQKGADSSRRTRNAAAVPAIALGEMALADRAHALTGALPTDDLMASWIATLREDVTARLGAGATAVDVEALLESTGSIASAGSAAATGPVIGFSAAGTPVVPSVPSVASPVGTAGAVAPSAAAVTAGAAGLAGSTMGAVVTAGVVAAVAAAFAVGVAVTESPVAELPEPPVITVEIDPLTGEILDSGTAPAVPPVSGAPADLPTLPTGSLPALPLDADPADVVDPPDDLLDLPVDLGDPVDGPVDETLGDPLGDPLDEPVPEPPTLPVGPPPTLPPLPPVGQGPLS